MSRKNNPWLLGNRTSVGERRNVGVYVHKEISRLYLIELWRPILHEDFRKDSPLHNSGIKVRRNKSQLITQLLIRKETLRALFELLAELIDRGEL